MLSENETYGAWPMSGEIDVCPSKLDHRQFTILFIQIMEARGNDQSYAAQGINYVRSSLNYGPLPTLARILFGWLSTKRVAEGFAADFHVYAMEWDSQFMRFYVDTRLRATMALVTRNE